MAAVYEPHYERAAGTYHFSTADGTPVHALALPTWEEAEQTLATAEPMSGYMVTPELITAPYPLGEIPQHLGQSQHRVATAQELSRRHPNGTLLLGTPSVDEQGTIRNSLAVISNGNVAGYIDKRGVIWVDEAELFSREVRQQTALRVGHAALVCSDAITAAAEGRVAQFIPEKKSNREDLLAKDVRTLMISSCWAVPRFDVASTPASYEERFSRALDRTLSGLFEHYPDLQDVIMADRSANETGVQPFTGHFRRIKDPASQE